MLYPGRKLGRQVDHSLSSLELQCKAERETQHTHLIFRRTPLTSPHGPPDAARKSSDYTRESSGLLLRFFVSLIAKFSKRLKGRSRTANKNKLKARKLEVSATA